MNERFNSVQNTWLSSLSLKDIKKFIINSFYMILLKKEDTLLFCFSLKIQNNSLYFYERKFHYF